MSQGLVTDILEACRQVLPSTRPLALHEPTLGELERRYVDDCLRSGWVSTAGPFVDRFEAELCAVTGAQHAIAVVNGTSALHAALLVAGVKAGEEVLSPTLSFVATANAISYSGAAAHFVDACEATLGVDPQALDLYLSSIADHSDGTTTNRSTGRRIAALVVMHTFGHPVDMNGICAVASRWGLAVVEDAAESLGSTYKNRHTGTIGRIGIISFNGNKIVTTGGGGAILTDDPTLAQQARHLCTTARTSAEWNFMHDQVGYNYRMPSLNAALGCAQLQQLPRLLAAKRELAHCYARAFAELTGVRLFVPDPHGASNHWLNTLLLDEANSEIRDEVLRALNAEGIAARPAWTPMHWLPMYKDCPRMPLRVAEKLARCIINLPSSPSLVSELS
jgi:perosamine synthetase